MKFSIDVSLYDAVQADGKTYKAMNWSAFDLAIIKSSEAMFVDPAFKLQWAAAAGKPRVAYHFFRSNVNAIAQAQMLLATLSDFTDNDYVAVDFETMDGQKGAQCLANLASFLYEAEKVVPASRILIYTSPSFWTELGGTKCSWASKYMLWLAQWPKDKWILNFPVNIFDGKGLAQLKSDIEMGVLKPSIPLPWKSVAVWQFTSRADTKVIPGYVGVKKVADYDAVFMPLISTVVNTLACPYCGHTLGSGWSYTQP